MKDEASVQNFLSSFSFARPWLSDSLSSFLSPSLPPFRSLPSSSRSPSLLLLSFPPSALPPSFRSSPPSVRLPIWRAEKLPPWRAGEFMSILREREREREVFASFFLASNSTGEGGTNEKNLQRTCDRPPRCFSSLFRFALELDEDLRRRLTCVRGQRGFREGGPCSSDRPHRTRGR